MSKKKSLALATAIANFKKGKDSRNVRLTEKEIAKFIDGQVKLKSEEIAELKATMEETIEEKQEDFRDVLLTGLEDASISDNSQRKSTAQEYVRTALSKLSSNSSYKESVEVSVEKLEAEVALLNQLRTELEDIQVEVEKED